jgi:hypothetical protein
MCVSSQINERVIGEGSFAKSFAMSSDSQNAIKKIKNLLDQMEAINPLNHYYNLFCLGRLSENISKIRIAVLLFLRIKLHNDRVVHICGIMPSKYGRKIILKLKT